MGLRKSWVVFAWVAGGVLLASLASPVSASPYAVQIVGAQGPFGPVPYNDTNAVLGMPTTRFYDQFGPFTGGITNPRVKLVEAAFNTSADTNNPITVSVVTTLGGGSSIIVRFDHPVYDNPANPYGVDFEVFGNSFYAASSAVNDHVDMGTCLLAGGGFYEPTKVSVSPGYTGQPGEDANDPDTWPWYRYDAGPFGDTPFPTEAFKWNRAATNWSDELMDFTKPVNPMLGERLNADGISAADAIDLYVGSGGGTGFDLKQSGFAWIQYVKVEGIDPDFSDGEIDAFSIVRLMVVGDAMSIAPENLTNGTGRLVFQDPAKTNRNQVILDFSAVSDVAKVETAVMNDPATLGPLTGSSVGAVQLKLSSVPGTNAVAFQADLSLAVSDDYRGSGGDLLVSGWDGTNWNLEGFTFTASNRMVLVAGITNLTALAVTQILPPGLGIQPGTNGFVFRFIPLMGLTHTLERSTNFVVWDPVATVVPTNTLPMTLMDTNGPMSRAFYRLRLNGP